MIPRLRIVSGLVLFAYATVHLCEISLGLVSIDAMEASRGWLGGIFRTAPGAMIMTLSILVHTLLGLEALYRRNTFAMTRMDMVQFATSIAIVPLLVPHIVGSAVAGNFYAIEPSFTSHIWLFWITNPTEGLRQIFVIAVVWIHGCIGVFTWLRLRPWWEKVAPFIYPLAVVLPVAAMLGFVEAGKVALNGGIPPFNPVKDTIAMTFEERIEALNAIKWTTIWIFTAMVAVTLALRWLRLRKYRSTTRIDFGGGYVVSAATGPTLLEMAIANDVPHARLCRGRGRCGTCRVLVEDHELPLEPPDRDELATLARVRAPEGSRLACRIKPTGGTVTVERLVEPDIDPARYHGRLRQKESLA